MSSIEPSVNPHFTSTLFEVKRKRYYIEADRKERFSFFIKNAKKICRKIYAKISYAKKSYAKKFMSKNHMVKIGQTKEKF